jgi:hypothetical protein
MEDSRELNCLPPPPAPCRLDNCLGRYHKWAGGACKVARRIDSIVTPCEARRMLEYRVLFAVAAACNVAFGIAAAFWPRAVFAAAGAPAAANSAAWQALGAVIVLFGFLYACVAVRPERGTAIVALGLALKVLGPVGWLISLPAGMTPGSFPMILVGDLVWWLPFAAYLLRGVSWRASIVAWLTSAVHLAACAGLLLVAPGTEAEPDMAARAAWVAAHVHLWSANWMTWAVASMSLLALATEWGARLVESGAARGSIAAACAVIAVGVACDLAGETAMIVAAGRPPEDVAAFAASARLYQWLSPAVANGLYCVAGLILSTLAWRIGWLRGWLGIAGYATWLVGLVLTPAAIADHRLAMTISGAGTMVLFVAWSACLGWRLRPRQSA